MKGKKCDELIDSDSELGVTLGFVLSPMQAKMKIE